jgi:hypothetical protein
MNKSVFVCASIVALVSLAATGLAGAKDDCETRIQKLVASNAEG